MLDYHFNISGKVLLNGKTVDIRPENITDLIRIYDFNNRLMPMNLIRLSLDKNTLDEIYKNAKTCTIQLRIGKFGKDKNKTTTAYPADATYIDAEYSVVVGSDINYNKELDEIANSGSGIPMRDKLKETYLGLVSKDCIDANKIVENSNILTTTMQNIVLSSLKHTHLLIEPFDYNDIEDQLIIPPNDTCASLIKYLNSVKVFYDTKYMLFFDEPNVTYLLSRSGRGVPMIGEDFNDVIFQIRPITDSKSMNIGMEKNWQQQAYVADISVMDSVYNIDHDTAKVINNIETIIAPSFDNSPFQLEEVRKMQTEINNVVNSFASQIGKYDKAVGNISERINSAMDGITEQINGVLKPLTNFQNDLIGAAMRQAGAIPTSVGVEVTDELTVNIDIIGSGIKSAANTVMKSAFSGAFDGLNIGLNARELMSQNAMNFAPDMYKLHFLDNKTSCCSFINCSEVMNKTVKNMGGLTSGFSNMLSGFTSQINNTLSSFSSVVSNVSSIVNQGQNLHQMLEMVRSNPYYGLLQDQYGDVDDTMTMMSTNIAKMGQALSMSSAAISTCNSYMNKYTEAVNDLQKFAKMATSFSGGLNSAGKIDVKSKFMSTYDSTRIFGSSGTSISNDMGALSNLIAQSITSIKGLKNINLASFGTKSKSGRLTYSDLLTLSSNIFSKDIRNIGQLGISKFTVDLNVGGGIMGKNKAVGTLILKTRNDNPNEVKNAKSELELRVNQLCINKFGLDPSVFTPNKRYTIKNYNGHGEKNGQFLLNTKIEIYTREDNTFICNTQLYFNKIPESIKYSTSATNISTPTTNTANSKK